MTKDNQHLILIEVDQWAGFLLSALPGSPVATPNLDALAQRGTLYTNAACNNPICLPSRLSMLTGKHPSTTQQFGFAGLAPRSLPWLPEVFRRANFTTAAIGKFHCRSIGADRWNFDVSEPTLMEERDLAAPAGSTYEAYCLDRGLPFPHDQMHGHSPEKGHGVAFAPEAPAEGHRMYRFSAPSAIPVEDSLETWTTNRAIHFLETHAQESTFSWVSYHRPHFPTTLPEPYYSKALQRETTLEDLPDENALRAMTGRERFLQFEDCSRLNIGDEQFQHILATYFTLIEWIDEEVGRLVAFLEEAGLADRTTIAFTADHGDDAGRNGLYNKHRGNLSWPVVQVPFIISPSAAHHPAATRGQVVDSAVSLVDLFPTFCELADIPAPDGLEGNPLFDADGHNNPLPADRTVFTEDLYFCDGEQRNSISALSGSWRYVFDTKAERRRLYKREANIETAVPEEKHIGVAIQLKKSMLGHLSQQIFGQYTGDDCKLIDCALDPDSKRLPLHQAGPRRTIYFRAAATHNGDEFVLLIPFYNRDCLLFHRGTPDGRNNYWDESMAVEPDPEQINQLLTAALEETAPMMTSVSVLRIEKEREDIPK